MKKKAKVLAACLASAIAAGAVSGCTNNASTEQDVPVISIISPDNGRVNKEDHVVIQEIEKRLGIQIELNLVTSAEFQNKLNVMAVADNLPDIVHTINYDFFEYLQQDAFYDITDLVETKGENMKKYIPQDVWDKVAYEGRYYTVPCYNWEGKFVSNIRQDWLDNVGLSMPETLDDLREVLRAFTYNDPDGNGKNDTYGLTTAGEITFVAFPDAFIPIFGAFGIQPGQYFERDGYAVPASVTEEYRQALIYLNQLYVEDKVIDPDIFIVKTDQARQAIAQGRFGFVNAWWSLVDILVNQMKMKENNPEVEWAIVPPVTGPDGKSGSRSAGCMNGSDSIASNSKHPEKAFELLEYLISDEGAMLALNGIEGVHYTIEDGVVKATEEGLKGKEEKWLDSMGQILIRTDLTMDYQKYNNPDSWVYIESARDNPLYRDLFEGVSTETTQKYLTDIKKLELTWLTKFVTGKEPIDNFDAYIEEWKQKGGQEMLNSYTEEYNKRTGKNLKPYIVE